MSIATAIADQSTPVEELGLRLVGRHIFHNRSCLELRAFEDGHLLTVIGPVSVEEASNAVLPEPGTVVQFHGQEMVWLQPHTVNGNQLLAHMLINGSVQSRYISDPATIVTVPNRERESARTIELLMAQHHAYEGFKAQLNDAANEWADDNDLCERYDEFMEDQGFSGRSRDYRARITVTFYRDVEGRNFETATEDIDGYDIKQWIADIDGDDIEWGIEED